jgi:probable F420-dependent oxidoreductase
MKLSVVTPLWQDREAEENLEIACIADNLGFDELWVGEMATYDAFAFAARVASKTRQIGFSLGPFAVSVRTPMTIAMGAATVASVAQRNVRVALGASSPVVVEQWHGRERARTATHMAESAQIVRGLLQGEKVSFSGELASCEGFHLRTAAPGADVTLAAFSPAAVRAAARHADRMLLNMVSPAAAAMLKKQLQKACAEAGIPEPRLAVWLATAVDPTEAEIAQILRAKVGYLSAPGYSDMFAAEGFSELVDFAKTRPHPKEVLARMTPDIASAAGLVGSSEHIAERLQAYAAAGVDEVCLVPASANGDYGLRSLEAMAALR